ncbi:MAG: hypothetical protein HYS80_02625 [Candidatus Aenigmarchaeota archaeon]|nr:hypothetical protein [Candidatus Aenigmarchaeota archaeon]
MKKLLSVLIAAIMLLAPMVFAVDIGEGIGIDITTEDFPPLIWLCDHRVVLDDNVEPGRVSDGGDRLVERINNYAFEGEQIEWKVLVMDKNGIEKIEDVYVTIGDTQGEGNDIDANCDISDFEPESIPDKCNARILEEELDDFDDNVMRFYTCTFTVETPESMYGEYWITGEVTDLDGLMGTFDENEYWFLNPIIGLSIDGDLTFEDVRPGTQAYSDTLLVGNDADDGSGVLLDMFISGTDFYDSSSSGAKCPTTNQLTLDNFRYYVVNGAYSSTGDLGIDVPAGRGDRNTDPEGYTNIGYGNGFNNPTPFYNAFEILQAPASVGGYYPANILAPGAEMAITFKLSLPEPCNGDFDSGSLYFWGEAI